MKLSVIIPAYNVERYIEKTLRSVFSQDSKDIEIIVVNDGSTDDTSKVIKTVFKNYPHHTKQLIHQHNQGVSVARNVGLSHAQGTYVLFLDGDDFLEPSFSIVLNPLLETSFDVLVYGYAEITEDGTILRTRQNQTMLEEHTLQSGAHWIQGLLEDTHIAWTGCVLYNKAFLETHHLAFTPGCRNGEDQEFFYKVFARASRIQSLSNVLSYYLERRSSISNTLNIARLDAVEAFMRGMKDAQSVLEDQETSLDEVLINKTLIDSYFYNLNALLRLIANQKKLTLTTLFTKISQEYPSLLMTIQTMLKTTKAPTLRAAFRAKLHQLSPKLYARLYVFTMRVVKR